MEIKISGSGGGVSPACFHSGATVEEEAAFRLYKEKKQLKKQKQTLIWDWKKMTIENTIENDTGKHYRFQYTVAVCYQDMLNGKLSINLDPFRIADIYGISNFAQQTALKKVLRAGNRGHKDLLQDINDIITALERWKQMLHEDELLVKAIESPRISEQMHSKPEFNSNGGWMCYE